MKSAIKAIGTYSKASARFIQSLFSPLEAIERTNERGERLLKGWEFLPEEKLALDLVQLRAKSQKSNIGLLGIAGNHCGEWLALPNEAPVLLGPSLAATVVLTPSDRGATQHFLYEPRSRELFAKDAKGFSVNGRPQFRAKLLDYDRVEILGNEFLFIQA